MAKHFIAYFKTEDDVLSAHASLKSLKTHDVTIDNIPNYLEEQNAIVPYALTNEATLNFGYASINAGGDNQNEEGLIHVLEGNVDDGDYEAAWHIFKENGGYQRSEDIK